MTDAFKEAFAYALLNEGREYTDTPHDAGGPTKMGVTQRAYEAYLKREVSVDEMKSLTIENAMRFYESQYWHPLQCEALTDSAISTALFDTGVLYGVGSAVKLAQKALCLCSLGIRIDGEMGPKTLRALNAVSRDQFLVNFHLFVVQRIDAIITLHPNNQKFRYGWMRRARRLLTLGSNVPLNKA